MSTKTHAPAAEDTGTPTPADLSGVINEEDAVASLGTLDLGDDLADDLPEEAPQDDPTPPDDEPEDDAGEEEPAEDEEPEPDDDSAAVEDQGEDEVADEAPAEEPAPRESKGRGAKEPAIPKSRFDQRTAQLRAKERELEELQAKLQEMENAKQRAEREANTLSDEQIAAKFAEANAALIDGDTEKASKIQTEVMAAIRQGQMAVDMGTTAGAIDPNKVAADVRDQIEFENTLKDIAARYPMFDEHGDKFDEALSEEAVGFQKFYFQQGYTRAEATARAVETVAKLHGLDTPASTEPARATMAKREQSAARKQKVAAARKAPPAVGGSSGANASATESVDLDAITVEDWSALPESVRSRLLGDGV